MDKSILAKCTLFKGLDGDRLDSALSFFCADEKSYRKGSFLNRISMTLPRFGLLLSGTVHVYRDDIYGHHMILANVSPGGTFGESICYLGREAQVYICAVTDADVLWLSTDSLRDISRVSTCEGAELSARFTAMLAERALGMNDRIQILSQVTIRDKLNAFFSQYTHGGRKTFEVPFDRGSMAFYLGTDRSALSRELGRMRELGLIAFTGNKFTILRPDKPDDIQ